LTRLTAKQKAAHLAQLRDYLARGMTNQEIIDVISKERSLSRSAFYRYLHMLHKQDTEELQKAGKEAFATSLALAKERLVRLYRNFVLIARSTDVATRDRIEAGLAERATIIDLFKLDIEGPTVLQANKELILYDRTLQQHLDYGSDNEDEPVRLLPSTGEGETEDKEERSDSNAVF